MRMFSKIILMNSPLSQKRLLLYMLSFQTICVLRGSENLDTSVVDNFSTVETKHLPGVAYLHVETNNGGTKHFVKAKTF